MADLVRAGHDPPDLAREFEPSAESIRAWVALAARKEGGREQKGESISAAERDELGRLRRENKRLRVERDSLSRAAAWLHARSSRQEWGPCRRGFKLMSANQATFPIATIARVLGV